MIANAEPKITYDFRYITAKFIILLFILLDHKNIQHFV